MGIVLKRFLGCADLEFGGRTIGGLGYFAGFVMFLMSFSVLILHEETLRDLQSQRNEETRKYWSGLSSIEFRAMFAMLMFGSFILILGAYQLMRAISLRELRGLKFFMALNILALFYTATLLFFPLTWILITWFVAQEIAICYSLWVVASIYVNFRGPVEK